VNRLIGDATKACKVFGWKPKTSFEELVEIMMDADIKKEELKSRLTR
jgi:GDPmannose 4,6-dehydratase